MGKDMDTKLIVRYAIRETLGIVVMAVALFWSAGRIDWRSAWATLHCLCFPRLTCPYADVEVRQRSLNGNGVHA